MSQQQRTGSFIVVKRKADEEEVTIGGKRVRLLGSYTTKPKEEDIVSHLGRKGLGKKRVIIQDFDTTEFKQFISELPEKRPRTKHRYDNDNDDDSDVSYSSDADSDIEKDKDKEICAVNDRLKVNLDSLKLDADKSPAKSPTSSPTVQLPRQQPPRLGLNLSAAESMTRKGDKYSVYFLLY